MKKTLFGGFLFLGGTIMYSIGTLGIADVSVQIHSLGLLDVVGVISMVAGIALGIWGIIKKD